MALRYLVVLLLPLLCARAAVPKELQALADQARALPPEFSADILLKLAASPLATDTQWKRQLIEDAFYSAGHAKVPYDTQSRIGGLDALTLQTRAVEDMLVLDPQRALVLFRGIAMPHFPKLTCQDALTPNVSGYYQTARLLFEGAFQRPQRSKGDDIQFLRERIAPIESASQVVPLLKLLNQVDLSPQVRNELMASFALVLDRLDRGNREFAQSEPLLVSAAVPEMHETPIFMPVLRAYIVRHVSGPRCSDRIQTGELPESVTQFNKLISRLDPAQTQLHPITAEESAPSKDDGTYPLSTLAQSAHYQQLTAAFNASDHASHTLEALQLLDSWKIEDEVSPGDYWYQAAAWHVDLMQSAPQGPARQNAMASLLHFLERQYDSDGDRGRWFIELGHMLDLAGPAAVPEAPWFLDQLVQSHNPTISLYAQLEKLLGSS